MKIEYFKIDELIPYERNAKLHPESQVAKIARSIQEFGFRNPVLVDQDNEIIAGHGRCLAAKEAGLDQVPVIRAEDLTLEQVRAYRIADNKLAESGWSQTILSEELQELKEAEFDLSLLGFDQDQIQELLVDPEYEGLTDPDDVPEKQEFSTIQPGDIWLMDQHRLLCGDCQDAGMLQVLFQDSQARLLLTDPPYNVNYGEKSNYPANKRKSLGRTIKNDHMREKDFYSFLLAVFSNCFSVLRNGGGCYVFHADRSGHVFRQSMIASGVPVKQVLIWVKNAAVMSRQDYHWQHEPILYGWKPGGKHFWSGGRKKKTVIEDDTLIRVHPHESGCYLSISDGARSIILDVPEYTVIGNYQAFDKTVLRHDRPAKSKEHLTMKPVALLEGLILNSSAVEDIVHDPFGGSGSTLIACERRGRVCYTSELDPAYCDVILKRWQNFTGKEATLEATGQTYNEVKRGRK